MTVRRRQKVSSIRHRNLVLIAAIAVLLVTASASAQIAIKVNDNVNVKFGILMQTQADELQDSATRGYAQNIFIRRARLLLGGQIAPNLTFFVETDSPNINKSLTTGTKNTQVSLFLQDAYVEYKVRPELILDAGLMLTSASRNGLQSAASLMPIDYGANTFAYSGPTQSSAGRDTGVQARGYFLNNKLEYRAGVFQGMRDNPQRELRLTGRVAYAFLEPESGYFYTGTYLGKKKVLTIGAGMEHQHLYRAYAADVFFDHPVGNGAITAQLDHVRYDGKTFLKTLPDQRDTLLEIGALAGKSKFMPVVQLQQKNRPDTKLGDENRYGAGVNYFMLGHNANVKGLYTRISPKVGKKSSQFTIQLQFFYF
jgi:hypothetical protein